MRSVVAMRFLQEIKEISLFTLYYPQKSGATTTVTLPSPERNNKIETSSGQAKGRTRGGQSYVYTKGAATSFADYEFIDLDDSERSALQSFFDSQADGMANSFQYDDHLGVTRTASFDQANLEWVNTAERNPPDDDPMWSVSIRLELED